MKYVRRVFTRELNIVLFFTVVFCFIRFFPFLFGKTIFYGDNYSLMVPSKIFTGMAIRNGELPFWNPYIFAGVNWIGDINQSVLYFTSYLFAFFDTLAAFHLSILIHYVIAIIGMYLLAKRHTGSIALSVFAALLWATSTQVVGSTNNLSTLQSIVWFPWIIWAGQTVTLSLPRKALFAGLVTAQFLAGYPQHVVYAVAAAVCHSFFLYGTKNWKGWLGGWISTMVLTLMVSAVAWVPFVESFVNSTRMEQTTAQAQTGSLHPSMLGKTFIAYLFDKPTAGMKWGPAWSGQPNMVWNISAVGFLLVCFSLTVKKLRTPRVKFFAAMSGITVLLSLGVYLPGFELLQQVVPFFRVGRYPSMALIITTLYLILWLIEIIQKISIPSVLTKIFTVGAFGTLIISIMGMILLKLEPQALWFALNTVSGGALAASAFHTLEKDILILSVLTENIVVVSIGMIVVLWALRKKIFWLVYTAIIIECLYSTQANFLFAPAAIYPSTKTPVVTTQQEYAALSSLLQSVDTRTLTRASNMPYSDFGSYWEALIVRHPFSDSFVDAEELRSFARLRNLQQGFAPDWNLYSKTRLINGYTALLPTDFSQIWQKPGEDARINFISSIDPLSEHTLRTWAVKYYLVDTSYPLYDEKLPEKIAASAGALRLYELRDTLSRFRFSDGQPAELNSILETANTQKFVVTSSHQQDFIVADRYDPNWHAWVNGKPTPVQNLDGMRSISVAAGKNEIEFEFIPFWLYCGAGSTVISLIFVLLVISTQRRSVLNRIKR
ncbi:hypothetical protein KA078_00975 [Candidatus Woesebacteria bacterium]|nr:hypothetical protein [Candidatus Woesebacteria bacterium]